MRICKIEFFGLRHGKFHAGHRHRLRQALENRRRRQMSNRVFIRAAFLLAIGLFGATASVPAIVLGNGTFVVTSTGDESDINPGDGLCQTTLGGGVCTLRAALEEANALPGSDVINFKIPGLGVQTIQPTTALPTITDSVTIDGFTQPGASPNTNVVGQPINAVLRIELDGSIAGAGIFISASNSTVRGLVINRASRLSSLPPPFPNQDVGVGISLYGNNNIIQGNFIGTDPTGSFALPNGAGVELASGAVLGGPNPSDRNLISGNRRDAIFSSGANTTVQGNYIGTKADGVSNLANGFYGIDLRGETVGARIGGTGGSQNIISFNKSGGILIANFPSGPLYPPNRIENNIISSNGADGITLYVSPAPAATTISANSIHDNAGAGIVEYSSPVVPPQIIGANPIGGTGCVRCTIEIFSDNGNQGAIFEGSTTASDTGVWSFTGAVHGPRVTVTATNASGYTSQFSQPFSVSSTGASLQLLNFSGEGFTEEKNCYLLSVQVQNNSASPVTRTITINEAATYLGPTGLPVTNKLDVRTTFSQPQVSCNKADGTSGPSGGPISQTLVIPANGSANYKFTISHDWEWIKAPNLVGNMSQLLLTAVSTAIPGGKWLLAVKVANGTLSLASAVDTVYNVADSSPTVKYTYTLDTSGLVGTASPQTVTAKVSSWKIGFLRGSLAATIESSLICQKARGNLIGAAACGFTMGEAISLYIAAWDPNDDYKTLEAPQPISIPQLGLLTDPTQRDMATRLTSAASLSRAARNSATKADAANRAGDAYWEAAQLAAARSFNDQAMMAVGGAADASYAVFGSLPDLSESDALTLRNVIASQGFGQDSEAVLVQFGISPSELAALRVEVADTDISLGRTGDQVILGLTLHEQALAKMSNSLLEAEMTIRTSSLGLVIKPVSPSTLSDLETQKTAIQFGLSQGRHTASLESQIINMKSRVEGLISSTGNTELLIPYYSFVVQALASLESLSTDLIPPTTSAEVVKAPNSNGWNNNDVTITLNSADNAGGSGVKKIDATFTGAKSGSQSLPGSSGSVAVATEGNSSLSYSAVDVAGNKESPKTLTIKLDKTPPLVSPTGVSSGATYALGAVPAAGCSTTDALSGVAKNATATITGGSALGVGTFTATCAGATDNAGNQAPPISVNYIVAYKVCALYDQTQAVPAGSIIPLKFYLCDSSGKDVSSSTVVVHATSITLNSGTGSAIVPTSGAANTDNDFRFEAKLGPSGGYIYNLNTKGFAKGTYRVTFTAGADPSSQVLQFQVK